MERVEISKKTAAKEQTTKSDTEEERRKQEVIGLLHEYNRIKDVTQIVLGALANLEGATVKEMHDKYKLPLES